MTFCGLLNGFYAMAWASCACCISMSFWISFAFAACESRAIFVELPVFFVFSVVPDATARDMLGWCREACLTAVTELPPGWMTKPDDRPRLCIVLCWAWFRSLTPLELGTVTLYCMAVLALLS